MDARLEIITGIHHSRVPLVTERVTIGTSAENDVCLEGDPTVSRLHAVLEHFPAGWCVSDLGSSNGTTVNGERIWAAHRLQDGDELRLGQTRLVFRDPGRSAGGLTEADEGSPSLTAREFDVLVALCRPLLRRDMFTEPASTREIADALVVTQAAVKLHLANLYAKFAIGPDGPRRARLANEALRRGAVSLAQLGEDAAR